MQKLNRVQRHLLSFGYPMGIVREYKTNSKHYREEVKDYVKEKVENNKRDVARKVI
jgi:hypothetical protein